MKILQGLLVKKIGRKKKLQRSKLRIKPENNKDKFIDNKKNFEKKYI